MVRTKDEAERSAAGAIEALKEVASKTKKTKTLKKKKASVAEVVEEREQVLSKSSMDIFSDITEGNEMTDLGRLALRYAEIRQLFY
jgi:hypothetical protein